MDPQTLTRAVILVAAGYLIGGIPWGIVVARLAGGPDPRSVGSGRTGGANVLRALGARAAAVSGILDMLKGTAAIALVRLFGAGPEIEALAGLAAILGHSRSPYIGLRGGRGVSPAYGGLLLISPLTAAVVLPVFIGVFALTRYSSLASLTGSAVGSVVLVALTLASGGPPAHAGYAFVATAMIWLFHADNIDRLLHGRERRFGEP